MRHSRRQSASCTTPAFRDMQAEREEFVKQIFPQLRRLCESRGSCANISQQNGVHTKWIHTLYRYNHPVARY